MIGWIFMISTIIFNNTKKIFIPSASFFHERAQKQYHQIFTKICEIVTMNEYFSYIMLSSFKDDVGDSGTANLYGLQDVHSWFRS